MRTWLGILCCLLVAGMQTVLTVEPDGSAVPATGSCACAARAPSCCCECSRSPASQPLPLTAIPIMAPTEVPWLAAGTAQLLAAPTSPESGFTASNISAIAIGRVPLYRRDCAYLI